MKPHRTLRLHGKSNCKMSLDHVDFSDARTQVPAGPRELSEDSAAAVLRETIEETGLVQPAPERLP